MFTLKSDFTNPVSAGSTPAGHDASARPQSGTPVQRAYINVSPQDTVIKNQNPPPAAMPLAQAPSVQPAVMPAAQPTPAPAQQPVQAAPQNMAQAMAQASSGMAQMTQRVAGQVLSFFFGNKKDAKADRSEEKEMRDRNDEGLLSIFGEAANPFSSSSKVNTGGNAGFGGGGK